MVAVVTLVVTFECADVDRTCTYHNLIGHCWIHDHHYERVQHCLFVHGRRHVNHILRVAGGGGLVEGFLLLLILPFLYAGYLVAEVPGPQLDT